MINRSTDYGDILFKHIILPVWISSYTYKEKIYNVYINGQNGRVVGEYPKDPIKVAITVILILAVVLSLLMYFDVIKF